MNESRHQISTNADSIGSNGKEKTFTEMLAGYIDCNDDKAFSSKVTEALKAYEAKDIKRFLSLIENIECLQSSPFWPVKGGAALISGDYFLYLSDDRNTIHSNKTKKTWRGQLSRNIEIAVIDPVKETVSNSIAADYDQQKQILVLFCRERVYLLNYHDKSFGYYTNHKRELISKERPDDPH
jgi:hypothetical protein